MGVCVRVYLLVGMLYVSDQQGDGVGDEGVGYLIDRELPLMS